MQGRKENTIEIINRESQANFRSSQWYQSRVASGMPQLLEPRLILMSPENPDISRLTEALEVIELIENNTGNASSYPKEVDFQMHDAMRTAIFLYPVVFQENNGTRKKSRLKQNNFEFDTEFVENFATLALVDSPELTAEMIAALSYVESMKQFDFIANQWQKSLVESCNFDYSADIPAQRQLVNLLNHPCNSETKYKLPNVKDMLKKALTNPNEEVQDIIMNYRAPLTDIITNIETVRNLDIEGLLMKSAIIINKLSHRSDADARKAAYWANAQELLSFYAPMLEMAGFIKMSEQCYSAANEYLLQGQPETLASARKIHSKAMVEWPEIVEGLTAHFESLGVFSIDGFRLKSIGSIANKITMYPEGDVIPDIGAIMLTTKKNLRNMNDVQDILAAVIEILVFNMGFQVANPNNDVPAIDIKWRDNPEVSEAIMNIYGNDYVVNMQPKTNDGYEGLNISAISRFGTTVEVQIHDPRTAKARDGIASHFIYSIGKHGSGELAASRRYLRDLRREISQLKEVKPLSKEVKKLEREFESELRNFNNLKIQMLSVINNSIAPRVAELANMGSRPRTNPNVIALLLEERGIGSEVKELLSNPEIMSQINWGINEP